MGKIKAKILKSDKISLVKKKNNVKGMGKILKKKAEEKVKVLRAEKQNVKEEVKKDSKSPSEDITNDLSQMEVMRKKEENARTLFVRFKTSNVKSVDEVRKVIPGVIRIRIPRQGMRRGSKPHVLFAFLEFSAREECVKIKGKLNSQVDLYYADFAGQNTDKKSESDSVNHKKRINPLKLYVGGLPFGVNDSKLKDLFPDAASASVFNSKGNLNKSLRYGFVEFKNPQETKTAFLASKDLRIEGQHLIVLFAKLNDSKKKKAKGLKKKAASDKKKAASDKKKAASDKKKSASDKVKGSSKENDVSKKESNTPSKKNLKRPKEEDEIESQEASPKKIKTQNSPVKPELKKPNKNGVSKTVTPKTATNGKKALKNGKTDDEEEDLEDEEEDIEDEEEDIEDEEEDIEDEEEDIEDEEEDIDEEEDLDEEEDDDEEDLSNDEDDDDDEESN